MKKNRIMVAVCLSMLFLFISGGLYIYNNFLQTKLSEQNCQMLQEIMQQQLYNFDQKLSNDKKTMKAFADLISKQPYSKQEMLKILKTLVADSDFDAMNYAFPDGTAYNQDGVEFSIADRAFYQDVMKGQTVTSDPVDSKVRNAKIIVVATPIIKDGEIIGILTGSYKSQELDKLFLPSFEGAGYDYVTTNDGYIVAKSINSYALADKDNVFEFWKNANFYMHDDLPTIQANLYENKSGHARYYYKDQKRYLHYATIGVNQWNLFAIVPEQAVTKISGSVLHVSSILTFLMAVLFLGITIYVYRSGQQHIAELTKIAYVDELTEAPTLAKFKLDAQRILAEHPEQSFLLVKLDVEKFKLINKMYGHATGDRLLKTITQGLKTNIRTQNDLFARLNIDEFVIFHEVLPVPEFEGNRDRFQSKVMDLMGDEFHFNLRIPAGHYLIEAGDTERDIALALEKVNFAHKQAKEQNLEVCDYNKTIEEVAVKKKDIESRMGPALAHNEFVVFLQPKYYLADETLRGAEALVRWKPDGMDMIYPSSFIPLFEENGFITKLDMYMFEKVCALIQKWQLEGKTPVTVSVNFSRLHLNNEDFVAELSRIANAYHVPHHYLEIELTENILFDNEDTLLNVLKALHDAGFTLSMDDFGSGYSSLGLLKNLPVDVIKLDRSFFVSAQNSKKALAVLTHVIDMARDMDIHTVAEGVEVKEHVDLLKSLGCDMVQGYYYAKPMPVSQFEGLIHQQDGTQAVNLV